jgi:hypothetical protein
MVVVTSPIGVHAPPAFAAITTTAPRSLWIKSKSENEDYQLRQITKKNKQELD